MPYQYQMGPPSLLPPPSSLPFLPPPSLLPACFSVLPLSLLRSPLLLPPAPPPLAASRPPCPRPRLPPFFRRPDQQGNPHIGEGRTLAPGRPRMQADGLRCLLRSLFPTRTSAHFPVQSFPRESGHPTLHVLFATQRAYSYFLVGASLAVQPVHLSQHTRAARARKSASMVSASMVSILPNSS